MLSSTLLPESSISHLKERAANLKKPVWSGETLKSDHYHVGIGASREDTTFGNELATILQKRGLKVTTDPDDIHSSRVFVLVYSDTTSRDENVVRHLTRAAERFNMGETIIVALIRRGCSPEIIDRIPDNLAYSLSNVVFLNYSTLAEPETVNLRQTMKDLTGKYTLIRVSWAASESLLTFHLYDFNDYVNDWAHF